MKIAILGGSFDPPHLGHLLVAKQTFDFTDIDEVWFMPCYSHPFDKKMTDCSHRFNMCRLLVDQEIKVSDFEIRLKKKCFTIDTVQTLKKTFRRDKFFWLIGSDNLKDFKKWKDWKRLLKEIKFLVFPRIDYPIKRTPKGFSILKSKLLVTSNLSSEIIRRRIKRGLSIKGMVAEKVEEYIAENKLYK